METAVKENTKDVLYAINKAIKLEMIDAQYIGGDGYNDLKLQKVIQDGESVQIFEFTVIDENTIKFVHRGFYEDGGREVVLLAIFLQYVKGMAFNLLKMIDDIK